MKMFTTYQRNPNATHFLYTIDGFNDEIRFAKEFSTLATEPDRIVIEAAQHFKNLVMPSMKEEKITINLFTQDGDYLSREDVTLSNPPEIIHVTKPTKTFWDPFKQT